VGLIMTKKQAESVAVAMRKAGWLDISVTRSRCAKTGWVVGRFDYIGGRALYSHWDDTRVQRLMIRHGEAE